MIKVPLNLEVLVIGLLTPGQNFINTSVEDLQAVVYPSIGVSTSQFRFQLD